MTVAELDRRISAHELTEWAAFERIAGPLGPQRGDYHAAQIAAATYNAAAGKKGKKASIGDLLIRWERRRPATPQTPEQMLRTVKRLNRKMGGTERG